MLLERIPSTDQGAGRWHMAAFNAVFGSRSTRAVDGQRPDRPRREGRPEGGPALYLDCGTEDRFGLSAGHRDLDAVLNQRRIVHTFELAPGDHGYDFVRARLERSLRFLGERLK